MAVRRPFFADGPIICPKWVTRAEPAVCREGLDRFGHRRPKCGVSGSCAGLYAGSVSRECPFYLLGSSNITAGHR